MTAAPTAQRVYAVVATVQSPTAISIRRATGNVLDTRHSIPGASVRGALAGSVIESRGREEANKPWFRRLFVEGGLQCTDLRKEGSTPWPMSVLACKTHRGERGHVLIDTLLAAAAKASVEAECSCTAKLEPPSGYTRRFTLKGERSPRDHTETIKTQRAAHVQIDTRYLKARNQQLFSAECLIQGQQFRGRMQVEEAGWEYLFPKREDGPTVLWIGRGRTRGQGRVAIEVSPADSENEAELGASGDLEARIEALNERARGSAALAGKVVISCTLRSPLLLYDRWLLPKVTPDARDFGLPEPDEYVRLAAFARQEVVTGWHGVSNVPKSEAVVIAAGSCFLFARDTGAGGRDAAIKQIARALYPVEQYGAGERTEDGFGEVAFCDGIHERLAQAWK